MKLDEFMEMVEREREAQRLTNLEKISNNKKGKLNVSKCLFRRKPLSRKNLSL